MSSLSPFFDLCERESVATKIANERARERDSLAAKRIWGSRDIPLPFGNMDPGVATYNNLNRNFSNTQQSRGVSTKLGGMPIISL